MLLLVPLLNTLGIMLDCYSLFTDEHNVLFNPNKCHCIRFHVTPSQVFQFPVSLQGVQLSWTNSILHFGHILTSCCNDDDNINARLNSFCSQSNYFLAHFDHVSFPIKSKLFLNFCYSFYGSQLKDLNHRDLITFQVAWRKVVRRTWGLSPPMHSIFLLFLLEGHSFRSMLISRFCSFFKSCFLIDNPNVLFIARNACVSAIHNFG